MTDEYYKSESTRLRELLADARIRSDYYLEMDIMAALFALQDEYCKEEE